MNRRFHTNPFVTDPDEPEPENGPDSPSSGDDTKISSAPSPKKSKRDLKKRVVSVPIGDVEGSKSKGEAYPPSDSWAWRKYGQKPIKGSPYPRGYYKCSSSKGCPARKQVERSHVDPTTLLITYASDHNHPLPTSKNHSSSSSSTKATAAAKSDITTKVPANFPPEEVNVFSEDPSSSSPPLLDDHFDWYSDVATTKILESPVSAGSMCTEADVAMVFAMGEEEESLFADLGELPECSLVFRSRRSSVVELEPDNSNNNNNNNNNVESNRTSCGLSVLPCYGTTG
ncbi:probable WRKY transcription factor 65 isoform X2 [Quercus robur]|uniref:probable WRKY transcription factor 65 isoform X1 n=1 Tax=Quercus robur TaxID=38942 RepID=UPI0021619157|nr:probable WRKY transcription factor 65 isoform X1 [Quercus robur]XP_050248640.1 probable WRKY transcription factor 65 isoform X2 [Quercus robur]